MDVEKHRACAAVAQCGRPDVEKETVLRRGLSQWAALRAARSVMHGIVDAIPWAWWQRRQEAPPRRVCPVAHPFEDVHASFRRAPDAACVRLRHDRARAAGEGGGQCQTGGRGRAGTRAAEELPPCRIRSVALRRHPYAPGFRNRAAGAPGHDKAISAIEALSSRDQATAQEHELGVPELLPVASPESAAIGRPIAHLMRVSSAIQFVSHVLPPSPEKACTKWMASSPRGVMTNRTTMGLPSHVSRSEKTPQPFENPPTVGTPRVPAPTAVTFRFHCRFTGSYRRSDASCRCPADLLLTSSSARLAAPFHTFWTRVVPSYSIHVCDPVSGCASRFTCVRHVPNSKSKSCWRPPAGPVSADREKVAAEPRVILERSAAKLVSQDLPSSLENACSKWYVWAVAPE